MKIINRTRRQILADKVVLADRFWSRAVGLLGRTEMENSEACLITPCRTVHTFGMRFPIDVYFLNAENKVIAVSANLKPNRISPFYTDAQSVLELRSGIKRPCQIGDELVLMENGHETP